MNLEPFIKLFFFKKKSHNAEKTEREDPLGFFNIHSFAKLQKTEGERCGGKKIGKKSHSAEKNLNGYCLVSSGFVCYAGDHFGSVPLANRYYLASSQKFV